jgi:hypothetical protein
MPVAEGTCASYCCGTSYTCVDIPAAAWTITGVIETNEPGDGSTYNSFPSADCSTDYTEAGDYLDPRPDAPKEK